MQKLALAFAVLLAAVPPAFADYPYPGKSSAAPVKCTGCKGVNASGQPNANLPTWPYSAPMVNHAGRVVDSTETTDYQAGTGFATARAMLVRIARTTHGSAPPRIYYQMGSAIAIYSLDRFFSSELPAGMVTISTAIGKQLNRKNDPNEKVLQWDALIYPQGNGSGWSVSFTDGQDKLFDFDVDDRGYVYVATGDFFGFGLVRDTGETGGGSSLSIVQGSQTNGEALDVARGSGLPALHFVPDHIVAVKAGSNYYAVTSGNDGGGRRVYDVTNPSTPTPVSFKTGPDNSFSGWTRDDARQRIAVASLAGSIDIYDNSAFVTGGSPITRFSALSGKSYRDVTVDEDGNFWTSEMTNAPGDNKVVKLERTSGGYVRRTYDVYGEAFTPQPQASYGWATINYGDKYLAVTGRTGAGGSADNDVKIFKIEGGEPVPVNVGGFFNKYYYKAPRDYAQPAGNVAGRTMGAYPLKWNNKSYVIYNTQGLGDVFELQGGDSISVAQKSGAFGTANPHSKSTVAGPYYGDLMKFTAASSSATPYALTWNFDNTESGSDNTQSGNTGVDGDHQFSGLDTAAKIETVRHVKATANVNAEVNGTVNVTLKVPVARIGIVGTSTALTTDGAALDFVAGDSITDASDGNVEGHYSAWTVDSATSNQTPDQPLTAPAVGAHTLTLAAKYGKYTAFTTNGAPYVDSVSSINLTVRPFVVTFGTPTVAGAAVTFKGTARVTQLTSVLSASTWTVDWSLKSGGSDVVPPQSGSAAVGTIPTFTVPDRTAIPSGSILQLKVTVASGLGTSVPAEFASHTITQTLLTPDPKINKTGCTSTGGACSFTIASKATPPNPTTGWTVTWTLKYGANTVATLTAPASQTFSPTLAAPGSYSISAKAATDLFEGTATPLSFDVTGPVCGDPPTAGQIQIYTSCDTCDVGQTVTMRPESFGNAYTFQNCEEYNWTFGDGGTLTTTQWQITHKYTTQGNFTIRVSIKKGTQTSPQFAQPIKIGPVIDPTCTAPSSVTVDYLGNKGCHPGVACKTTESVKFTAYRAGLGLQTCDATSWTYSDGGGSSNASPSHTFTSAGTHTATVLVFNSFGQATGSVDFQVVPDDTGQCQAPPDSSKVYTDFSGATSGCNGDNGKVCKPAESIKFTVRAFLGTTIQACDKFEWNFGDGSALSTQAEPSHTFVGNVPSYHVTVRIYNSTNSTGNIVAVDVPYPASIKPAPVLTFAGFPVKGTKGKVVTFTANASIPATGWSWTFSDGPADNSQAAAVGTSNTITHTFATQGNYKVTVKARNADDITTASTAQVDNDIAIDDIPEYRFLLPAVAHAGGIGSVWRTDIQIYSSDSTISASNPLALTASYKGVDYPLQMKKSTLIIEDILNELRPNQTEQGALLITVRTAVAPQIWSRTYNQTADGTFGQFIPAILLNEAGGGSAVGEGKYYLAGLRSNNRYRTNVGLVNPNSQSITAIVRLYDDAGFPVGQAISRPLSPFQLDQFGVTGPADRPFSVEIEVPAGTWLIGYASFIDGGSSDPVYIQAIRQSELGSADYRETAVPGVGHVGAWRSDVTIYNANGRPVTVDLAYHNAAGTKVAEAKNIPINAGQFLQYGDLLRQGVLGNVADGVGMLRVSVPSTVAADYFPMVFARTYNDNGTNKTYGQGIAGFAVNRANVKSGKSALIPGVRSNTSYYTNVGLTNVSGTVAKANVIVLDPFTGATVRSIEYTLQPNESIVATQFSLDGRDNASLRIEATGGDIWAFASIIDRGTLDPEYVPATPLQ
ncbi:MAG TPA: PKD domain-containing protein [Thermoanaerobaculia bacterium]|nr:PKD domain-containing protein [Thermoanaerobaculia bacterium]